MFEETAKSGGIGEHISAKLLDLGYKGKFKINAVGNEFVPQGKPNEILKSYDLDSQAMLKYF